MIFYVFYLQINVFNIYAVYVCVCLCVFATMYWWNKMNIKWISNVRPSVHKTFSISMK